MLSKQLLSNINPYKLFLADSIGALLSALLLGIVLVNLEHTFGMPKNTLYILSLCAIAFCIYSFLCFFFKVKNWPPFMKAIAITNLGYCCLTLGLVIYFHQQITALGYIYFILEIIIIIMLAIIELKRATHPYHEK
jgi:hypothetical protein